MSDRTIMMRALALCFTAACGAGIEEVPQVTSTAEALRSYNGAAFNARAYNARAYNARAYNGTVWGFDAVKKDGYQGHGYTVSTFDGRTFTGKSIKLIGCLVRFNGLDNDSLGGGFTISTDEPDGLRFRFTGPTALVRADGTPTDIQTYALEVDDGSGFIPMYETDAFVPISIVALKGWWNSCAGSLGTALGGKWADDGKITFAARGYVIAKCVELGYRPWDAALTDAAKLHLSCVRMLRADYCGDGNTWTRDGTLLNVYDKARVQIRETEIPIVGDSTKVWRFEAEWTADGAQCASSHRIQEFSPMCGGQAIEQSLEENTCGLMRSTGAFNAKGTMMMSEFVRSLAP